MRSYINHIFSLSLCRASFILIVLPLVSSCENKISKETIPKIWTSYNPVNGLEQDFADMRAQGIEAIQPGVWGEDTHYATELIRAARKYGMKIIMGFPEITEMAYAIPEENRVRAVMIGGSWQGKAIDRFRFSFSPEKHEIAIQRPVYNTGNVYGKSGRYFPNVQPPIKAEVIVKEKDFDGKQHLHIVQADISEQIDENHWKMKFDLSSVNGALDEVVLAVYWISEGTRDYWIFGDAASAFAESTREALRNTVLQEIEIWKEANGGTFPSDLIFAARFGDECFHISGHLNGEECSYPLWDYSDPAIEHFVENNPGLHYPRGKSWPDMFGRESCAAFMFQFHKANAELAGIIKEVLQQERLENILLFRNITRADVFSINNDHDGSGLDMLAATLDIVHGDPYPARGPDLYNDWEIPVDMSYLQGLARKHKKLLVPWLQAHSYMAGSGGLQDPSPGQLQKMYQQHQAFQTDAIMWLGYGPGYTFPEKRKDSWMQAGEIHIHFRNQKKADKNTAMADFALIRPYTVRALSDIDGRNPLDAFVCHSVLFKAVMNNKLSYDPFEPFSLKELSPSHLSEYPFIVASTGSLGSAELQVLKTNGTPVVLFIYDADNDEIDFEYTGIRTLKEKIRRDIILQDVENNIQIKAGAMDVYEIEKDIPVHLFYNNHPCIWQNDNLIIVSCIGTEDDHAMAEWLWDHLLHTFASLQNKKR
ncbi:MAG: hypothetical protein JJU28_11420 [Cyclobacteriaceae bacterium]|nr:hypothetical protein [Cyclobacteriaceae bacterium]